MQIRKKDYNPEKHKRQLAIFVRQPYADDLARGWKSIEIEDVATDYRGDVLLCSARKYEYPNMPAGCTIALLELYDCKQVLELTEEEWKQTHIQVDKRILLKEGYAWMFRNPRRVVEMPVLPNRKPVQYIYHDDNNFIIEYPKYIIYDI